MEFPRVSYQTHHNHSKHLHLLVRVVPRLYASPHIAGRFAVAFVPQPAGKDSVCLCSSELPIIPSRHIGVRKNSVKKHKDGATRLQRPTVVLDCHSALCTLKEMLPTPLYQALSPSIGGFSAKYKSLGSMPASCALTKQRSPKIEFCRRRFNSARGLSSARHSAKETLQVSITKAQSVGKE